MAYKLIWSPAAYDDLHDIVVFIARDNPDRAMSFGYQLFQRSTTFKVFPSWVAQFPNTKILTFARSSFGLTGLSMRVNHARKLCEIARVWHSARGIPQL